MADAKLDFTRVKPDDVKVGKDAPIHVTKALLDTYGCVVVENLVPSNFIQDLIKYAKEYVADVVDGMPLKDDEELASDVWNRIAHA